MAKVPLTDIRHLLATGFGTGFAPVIPGTFGTLPGFLLYAILLPLPLWAYLLALVALFILGIYLCAYTAKALQTDDPSAVVWDEMVALPLVLAGFPLDWKFLLAGFVLFRVFDMCKPWPISWFDRRIHGGLGIMLDDVIAAVFAWGSLWAIATWLAWW